MFLMMIYTCIAVTLSLLLLYFWKIINRFSHTNVSYLPLLTIIENEFWRILGRQHMINCYMDVINGFPNDKVVGHIELTNSAFIVRDVDTITRVTTTGFEHFMDRQRVPYKNYEPLLTRGLPMLKGNEWKSMRSSVCPALSDAKVQLMMPEIVRVGEEMVSVLKKRIQESGNPFIDVEAKDLAERYSSDIIAACTFGLNIKSKSTETEFYEMCKEIIKLDLKRNLKLNLYRSYPKLAQMLNVSNLPRETVKYFKALVSSTLKLQNDHAKHNFINMIKENKEEWIQTDLEAQAMLFILAGFEPIATSISFLLYELAINPDEQELLANEIREHSLRYNGNLDFQSIHNMTYLDMVVSEGLRLWPAVPFVDRCCVKNYNIGRPSSRAKKDLIIKKDDILIIPIFAIHRNINNFPDPLKFDPQRFSTKNRDQIKPFTFLPFGLGPRNCIGSHFALCVIKVLLYQLLREIEVYPFERTCFPPQLPEHGYTLGLRGGTWIRCRLRTAKKILK